MPELPEVEVTRLGLLPHLPTLKIINIWWSGKKLRTPMPLQLLQRSIKQQEISTIDRRAKYLLFRMTNKAVLVVHLGMTGKLSLLQQDIPKAKHDHLALSLSNGKELRFNDSRRFGSVTVWPPDRAEEMERDFSAKEGMEPLGKEFTPQSLLALASNKKLAIKPFLMNSKYVAGIGNIYANETLFKAGIHPNTPAQHITKKQWQKIVAAAKSTLKQAIAAGGTTISDFLGSSGQPGYFQLQLNVYGKKDTPCPQCQSLVLKTELAGRATFCCPRCQPKQQPAKKPCRKKKT
ncbi:bifunctional DNA-formamidopyrimidine glycosylase/DNA-(apurinic or apyrimidinic site) lyase [Desulfogranum marinum]|uniref:bifunctional DNA-formamidopyrimidine glycosylase/DNA-(apurinic or apyrimidinic site) lyase n=1 Tax=Desulfogranum marinum TaxID=453220 RepID=UPI00196647D5|nr:bifunctional DNA-formamidopyrimidine glycosylase/DNA-(apurinic or apyrimidinic site) lyase [Desulfogranum marinum]MBM9513994.1 bifunctional DNA-formamidopyrimidine glycosylase/DNA-(apurinic or apyrimidinic site) lyase [Desulfogranum marinum]